MSEFCEVVTVGLVISFLLPIYEIVHKEFLHFGLVLLVCVIFKKLLEFLFIDKQLCFLIDIIVSFLICFFQFGSRSGVIFIFYLILRTLC